MAFDRVVVRCLHAYSKCIICEERHYGIDASGRSMSAASWKPETFTDRCWLSLNGDLMSSVYQAAL
jgi:hypothetical protein